MENNLCKRFGATGPEGLLGDDATVKVTAITLRKNGDAVVYYEKTIDDATTNESKVLVKADAGPVWESEDCAEACLEAVVG